QATGYGPTWGKSRLIQNAGGLLKRVSQAQSQVRTQAVPKIDGDILIGLISRTNPLIEGKARTVRENPMQPCGSLIQCYVRKNRVAYITHGVGRYAAQDVVTV